MRASPGRTWPRAARSRKASIPARASVLVWVSAEATDSVNSPSCLDMSAMRPIAPIAIVFTIGALPAIVPARAIALSSASSSPTK